MFGGERYLPEARTRCIEDRVGDGCKHGFAHGFAGAVVRKIGPVRIRISVNQYHVNLGWRIGGGSRYWDADSPTLIRDLSAAIKREALPFLMPLRTIEDVATAGISLHRFGDPRSEEAHNVLGLVAVCLWGPLAAWAGEASPAEPVSAPYTVYGHAAGGPRRACR